MSNHKKEKKEFNIPINIFSRKKEEVDEEKSENEIIPVMISNKESKSLDMEDKGAEEKREFFSYEKMDSKDKASVKKMAWVKRKNEAERRKIMWVVVGCFMVVIIAVWAIFLKYNILLENLSIKQMQRDEEWVKIKDNFDKSYQNFANVVEEYGKEADLINGTTTDMSMSQNALTKNEIGTSTAQEVIDDNKKINISNEDIEKLKEKIIEKK